MDRAAGREVARDREFALMYSQNDEERYVLEATAGIERGRFLDVGANDGEMFSNTRALALAGWGGICIEASPLPLAKLLARYADRPDILVVGAVVVAGKAPPVVPFHVCGGSDGLSTLDPDQRRRWEGQTSYRTMYAPTIALGTLLFSLPSVGGRVAPDVDMISIDVEGESAAIFLALPLMVLAEVTCVVVEHDGRQPEIKERAARADMRAIAENAENLILVRA